MSLHNALYSLGLIVSQTPFSNWYVYKIHPGLTGLHPRVLSMGLFQSMMVHCSSAAIGEQPRLLFHKLTMRQIFQVFFSLLHHLVWMNKWLPTSVKHEEVVKLLNKLNDLIGCVRVGKWVKHGRPTPGLILLVSVCILNKWHKRESREEASWRPIHLIQLLWLSPLQLYGLVNFHTYLRTKCL